MRLFILEVHSLQHRQSERSTCLFVSGGWVTQGGVSVCMSDGGYVFTAVCLFVSRITRKVMDGFGRNFLKSVIVRALLVIRTCNRYQLP